MNGNGEDITRREDTTDITKHDGYTDIDYSPEYYTIDSCNKMRTITVREGRHNEKRLGKEGILTMATQAIGYEENYQELRKRMTRRMSRPLRMM